MTAISRVREVGLVAAGRGGLALLRNKRLQRRYGFDDWHVGADYSLKPYKAKVIAAVGRDRPNCVVEVGCGLGDLIGRVAAPKAIGVDRETQVIDAARELHPGCEFLVGSLADVPRLLPARVSRIDALILVNWPHLLRPHEIVGSISSLAAQVPVGRVYVDSIHPGTPDYAHHHTVDDLHGIGRLVDVVENIDHVRDLFIFDSRPGVRG